jgi:hypothetical protein
MSETEQQVLRHLWQTLTGQRRRSDDYAITYDGRRILVRTADAQVVALSAHTLDPDQDRQAADLRDLILPPEAE